MCKGDHKLFMCGLFRRKSTNDRVKFVSEHNLCNICLSHSHNTNACLSSYKCTINNCKGSHSSLIHVNVASSNSANSISLNVDHNDSICMPILPVTINGIYDTYALLDTGSSGSFCSDRWLSR